mmetsp:Transcript_41889/g.76568  ORF Transcript_41889/g.76568 Transcript_41889/m.76568 type:complete len:222 (-) Transcript_41889:141-806(-)
MAVAVEAHGNNGINTKIRISIGRGTALAVVIMAVVQINHHSSSNNNGHRRIISRHLISSMVVVVGEATFISSSHMGMVGEERGAFNVNHLIKHSSNNIIALHLVNINIIVMAEDRDLLRPMAGFSNNNRGIRSSRDSGEEEAEEMLEDTMIREEEVLRLLIEVVAALHPTWVVLLPIWVDLLLMVIIGIKGVNDQGMTMVVVVVEMQGVIQGAVVGRSSSK